MKPTFRSHDSESNRPTITRRRAVAMLAGSASVGVAALAVGSDDARAEISVDDLAVSDAERRTEHPEATPRIDVTVAFAFDVPRISETELWLSVGPTDSDRQQLDDATVTTNTTTVESDREFGASLLDHDAFEADDFQPDAETTVEYELDIEVGITILDGDDEIATDTATDTATVLVENTADGTEVSIGGGGTLGFEV